VVQVYPVVGVLLLALAERIVDVLQDNLLAKINVQMVLIMTGMVILMHKIVIVAGEINVQAGLVVTYLTEDGNLHQQFVDLQPEHAILQSLVMAAVIIVPLIQNLFQALFVELEEIGVILLKFATEQIMLVLQILKEMVKLVELQLDHVILQMCVVVEPVLQMRLILP